MKINFYKTCVEFERSGQENLGSEWLLMSLNIQDGTTLTTIGTVFVFCPPHCTELIKMVLEVVLKMKIIMMMMKITMIQIYIVLIVSLPLGSLR